MVLLENYLVLANEVDQATICATSVTNHGYSIVEFSEFKGQVNKGKCSLLASLD